MSPTERPARFSSRICVVPRVCNHETSFLPEYLVKIGGA